MQITTFRCFIFMKITKKQAVETCFPAYLFNFRELSLHAEILFRFYDSLPPDCSFRNCEGVMPLIFLKAWMKVAAEL